MKKVLLFTIVSFSVLFCQAQIKRNIDGVVLGKTTKSEIKKHLNAKNIYPKMIEDGKSIIGEGDISFGGVIWSGAKYFFFNDIVYKVVYIKQYSGKVSEIHQLDETYKDLRNKLSKKYTKQNPPSKNAIIPDRLFISGKETTVEVKKVLKRSNRLLCLTYTDVELDKKAKKKDYDDL